jgi:SAM-dependent methyltransferase
MLRRAPPATIRAMRAVRTAALRALEPLDLLSRLINNKSRLPPLYLRREVGDLGSFEASGAEFTAYCKLLAGLKSNQAVLDVGCGCGLVALELEKYLGPQGSYRGIDVDRRAIDWCIANITSRSRNFRFDHVNILSRRYNPDGNRSSDQLRIVAPPEGFDLVLVKSVFTHLLTHDLESYLREVAKVLSKNGSCLATFFVLSTMADADDGGFSFGDDSCRYRSAASPETAVAYSETYLRRTLKASGLSLREIHYGSWRGSGDGLSHQDVLLLSRS